MTEAEFIRYIDCAFPYHDLSRAIELIDLSCTISSSAGFTVMYELASVPASKSVERAQLYEFLNHLRKRLRHPLTELVAGVAEEMIAGREVSVSDAVAAMRTIAAFNGQYAALSIPYFSCDDTEGLSDSVYNEIVDEWQATKPAAMPDTGRNS